MTNLMKRSSWRNAATHASGNLPSTQRAKQRDGRSLRLVCALSLVLVTLSSTTPCPPLHENDRGVLQSWRATLEVKPEQAGALIEIPVAFHVIYNVNERTGQETGRVPLSMLEAQIDVLNSAFAGTGYSFTLASADWTRKKRWYQFNNEDSIKSSLAIDPAHNLNIYVAGIGDGLLGWAYFPDSYPESHYMHGIVLLNESLPGGTATPYNEGDVLVHEVGHYLGLYDTVQGGVEKPGERSIDSVSEASLECPEGHSRGNYMDLTSDACMGHFTSEQIARMKAMVAAHRPSLGNQGRE